jgi:hypothetical protein
MTPFWWGGSVGARKTKDRRCSGWNLCSDIRIGFRIRRGLASRLPSFRCSPFPSGNASDEAEKTGDGAEWEEWRLGVGGQEGVRTVLLMHSKNGEEVRVEGVVSSRVVLVEPSGSIEGPTADELLYPSKAWERGHEWYRRMSLPNYAAGGLY